MTIFVITVLLHNSNFTKVREARNVITADTEIDEFCEVNLFEEAKKTRKTT